MANTEDKPNIEGLRREMRGLFTLPDHGDVSRKLKTISDYFHYIAESIDYYRIRFTGDSEILGDFESISLFLIDKLEAYPEKYQKEITSVFEAEKIRETISMFSNISPTHLAMIRSTGILAAIFNFSPHMLYRKMPTAPISSDSLLQVKSALKRISQSLIFISTINVFDAEEALNDFKENYDTDLINKQKVLLYIQMLRSEIIDIPNADKQDKILKQLDKIEQEIKKDKVRWSIIITGFFVLLGFFADVKTLSPETYEKPSQLVQTILSTIHDGGVVKNSKYKTLSLPYKSNDESQTPQKNPIVNPVNEPLIKEEDESPNFDKDKQT